ncbi:SUMF1/EgtB/PvdO family nonheme iron enzyme [Duganella sp. FT80W]|uniref:SUMF1/EgtB/PvdO family nonheme iron enzyme n=1 Tax=Duganella guangzhouensis TaxID=2666084 RepID=A0A6I2KS52_9BURK|nr:SUMF1/EgtB/PvdO family nonheme iron enzyme [Duganella guangzhouensis]MRW88438.1 SUMF1/EgtB/PvdO family nonheme iron enzyme [Duganella guangzhouensis]
MRTNVIKQLAVGSLLGCAALAWFTGAGAGVRPSPVLAALGTEALCEAGGGLPPEWGRNPRAGMVKLPDGEFVFGSTRGYQDERPADAQPVKVHGFWIDQTEVTNAQFERFVRATGYVTEAEKEGAGVVFHTPDQQELQRRSYAWWSYVRGASWHNPTGASPAPPPPNQPVIMITEADALAYAHWLGRDLPTEAEWEYAAKAGRSDAALDAAPVDGAGRPSANYFQGLFPLKDTAQDGHAGLAAVGCYAANPFGLYDMIGNAWEWTKDAYTGPRQPHNNGDTAAVAAAAGAHRPDVPMVIKGGSFLCSPDYCVRYRASARESQEANLGASHIGFRTVLRAS